MNTQHSPGPWKLKSDPYPNGNPYFVITAGKAYFGDASDPQGFHTSIICTEADARLIVMAPELYEALKALVEEIDGTFPFEKLQAAKDAIERVDGTMHLSAAA